MKPYAVIDIGTNTFHLLIAAKDEGAFIQELYRDSRFVKLAEAGIERIGPAPYQRGLDTLAQFRQVMDEHGIPAERVAALGTAALRTAANGPAFVRQSWEQYGIAIQLIDGEREAQLIYQGVILAVPPSEAPMLIMDIGGGSVEFIIADQQGLHWAQSFPIGVAVLYRQFHRAEPITDAEMDVLRQFLGQTLAPLRQALQRFPCSRLAGASGTFDVLAGIIGRPGSNGLHVWADPQDFFPLYHQVRRLTPEQRHAFPGIAPERADMIVVALILLEVVIEMAGIQQIAASQYAMKEGMLYEMVSARD
jgi:exopolyphosphatase / guanosine-5'-triphosphate,3'-diphosphate pyrophosphatase